MVQPELTPVEIVGKPNKFGCEVIEAGSPLALDNGQFTFGNKIPFIHIPIQMKRNDKGILTGKYNCKTKSNK